MVGREVAVPDLNTSSFLPLFRGLKPLGMSFFLLELWLIPALAGQGTPCGVPHHSVDIK